MPCICLLLVSIMPSVAAGTVHLSIDASKAGAKIDRSLFGQFAENLGHGLYEGIWVGADSPIPNTHGIRNDVVSALRASGGPMSAGRTTASATSVKLLVGRRSRQQQLRHAILTGSPFWALEKRSGVVAAI